MVLHKSLMKNSRVISCAPQFREGDLVIYKKNNEDLSIVNGSNGKVIVDFNSEGIVKIPADLTLLTYSGDYLLLHAYAVTCHSAQGSEFDIVVVIVEDIQLVERSWLYTAITRAKKKVIVIAFSDAIRNNLNRGFTASKIEVRFQL